MTKNTKGFIAVVAIAITGYVLYKHFNPSKNKQVQFLIKNNFSQGTPGSLIALGDDYILAWYKAAKQNLLQFTLNGVNYNTSGGTKI